MNFQDYINNSTPTDLHEDTEHLHEASDPKPKTFRPYHPNLEEFKTMMASRDSLLGITKSYPILAMQIKASTVYFIWYNPENEQYRVSSYTPNKGITSDPINWYKTYSIAEHGLRINAK